MNISNMSPEDRGSPRVGIQRISFITRFYGSARLGVGKYEESLYRRIAELANVEQFAIEPVYVPKRMVNAARLIGRDLQEAARNLPYRIPLAAQRDSLIHLSNEVLAPALFRHAGPSVITVHHLPPVATREFRRESGYLWGLYLLSIAAIRKADRVIADSNWTASQVERKLRFSRQRIDVVPLGVDHQLFRKLPPGPHFWERYNLGTGPYVLYVGGFSQRKNVATLVAAFAATRQQFESAELLLVGPTDNGSEGLVQQWVNSTPGCRYLGYLPLEALIEIYNAADVFVIPSKIEGFSLPTLEAMSCGCPVIVARASALPELVGDAALSFAPDDAGELKAKLIDVLCCENVKAVRSLQSMEQSKKYSWDRTAELTVDAYHRVLDPSIRRRAQAW